MPSRFDDCPVPSRHPSTRFDTAFMADALRANIVLEKPAANYTAQLLPTTSSGAAQTIFAKVYPCGFMMILK